MSLGTASIAQHCKALRLAAVGAQFAHWPRKPVNRTTPICITSKLCSMPR